MMGWRALASQDGCHVVYFIDDYGRLLAVFAAERPEDFHDEHASLVAVLTCNEFADKP